MLPERTTERINKEGKGSHQVQRFVFMAMGIMVFVGIIAVAVFFIALQGEEQIMVPEVRGKDLIAALLELQEKELNSRIQLRPSQSIAEKGLILEQDPPPGTIVRAGRLIQLVVSQGMLINTVENYIGRTIDEVRLDLQTLFASAPQALLSLKEPFMYEYSTDSPGIILQQSPKPGTPVSGPIALELVVSRGPEDTMIRVPDLIGLSISDALEQISQSGINFEFSLRQARGAEIPETVVSQNPPGQSRIPGTTRVAITVASPPTPIVEKDEVFALFRYPMPRNPYPLTVWLEVQLPSGERYRLITVEYPGGEFTVPYRLPIGSTLILSMLNRELYRETVKVPPLDELYWN
ncbi:MAG: PASTA domain-containing protein [Treponema sp.]|jgi:beta-lactam-binding protein with PASTA domain|nr:PASTA domain-containing protein [Treponema sp.]